MTNALFNSDGSENDLSSDIEALKTRYTKADGSVDIDELLKAKAHADKHIKNVEAERAGLYEDLKGRTALEELVSKIKETPNNVNHEPQVNSNNATPLSEQDVEAKLDAKLSAYRKQLQYEQNVEHVKSELSKMWGPDYQAKLKAKARELGETEDDLGALAAAKPKVFLKLMSEGEKQIYNPAPPSSSNRMQSNVSNGNAKGKSYFDKLRKENPSHYWSIAVQKELHTAAASVPKEVWEKS
jgi:hypothetical protein